MSTEDGSQPMAIGDPLPDVELLDEEGQPVRLRELVAGVPAVIYFYPADGTPVCTAEACRFRDRMEEFRDLDAAVIGISGDSPESHTRFAEKHRLPFRLLSDPNGAVRRRFGIGRTLGILPGRVTYVVDREGIIRHMHSGQFGARKHVREALAALERVRGS